MRFVASLLLTFVFTQSYSQIIANVGLYVVGNPQPMNKNELEKFKHTETIFILSDLYSKEDYEKVLKNTWTITPYKIIAHKDINFDIYTNNKYSVAQLRYVVQKIYSGNSIIGEYPATYIDIMTFDTDKIRAKTKSYSQEKLDKNTDDILSKNSTLIARILLYAKDDFTDEALGRSNETNTSIMYTEEVLYNYNPGFLKNYFQKINDVLEKNEVYSMVVGVSLPEIQNLAKSKLYIPSYVTIKRSSKTKEDNKEDEQNLMKEYGYHFEIIQGSEMGNKIMNKEEFYYLRYARQNASRYFQIVNSLTGEIIYNDYIYGLSTNLKSKNFLDLNNAIAESIKK